MERALLRDEVSAPAADRLRRDDRVELVEALPAEGDTAHGDSYAIVVGEPETPLAELRPKDAVVFEQVFEDALLVAVKPTGEDDGEGVGDWGHAAGERSGLVRPPGERQGSCDWRRSSCD